MTEKEKYLTSWLNYRYEYIADTVKDRKCNCGGDPYFVLLKFKIKGVKIIYDFDFLCIDCYNKKIIVKGGK